MGGTFRSAATVRPIPAWTFRMPCFSVAKRGAEEAERSMWSLWEDSQQCYFRIYRRYLAYRRDDSDTQQAEAECYKVKLGEKQKRQTSLTGDDRRTGKNLRRPHQLVAVDGVGGAKQRRLEEDKLSTDGEKVQVPGLIDLLERQKFARFIGRKVR